MSRYFNLPVVLKGLFSLTERLFGVTVEPMERPVPVWQEDVRVFRVRDAAGAEIAQFYFDPYSRPETKGGGAWMNEFRARERRADGTLRTPLAVICCNQARPDAQGRALMRFSEVETLFHEFGHALQHMLTTVDDVDASGLNLIDWDAVEVASQFMENWCYDAKTVKAFARHVETHAPIPDALLARVRAAKNDRAATASLRQLAFARLDMALHVDPPERAQGADLRRRHAGRHRARRPLPQRLHAHLRGWLRRRVLRLQMERGDERGRLRRVRGGRTGR